jgi:hypothetical protein
MLAAGGRTVIVLDAISDRPGVTGQAPFGGDGVTRAVVLDQIQPSDPPDIDSRGVVTNWHAWLI